MSSYNYSGSMDNPGCLDLSPLKGWRVTFDKALAISMPFIERIGFSKAGVIGLWVAHNSSDENHLLEELCRMLRQVIDNLLNQHGVPAEAIISPRPYWSPEGRTKAMLDVNPYSKTRGRRKRMHVVKMFWYIRDSGNGPAFKPADEREGNGLYFFEWCEHNEGIYPRPQGEEMPAENLFSPYHYSYGKQYGRIRNDLLAPVVGG